MLLEYPHAKVTINLCGVLTEMLNDHGAFDILVDILRLANNKQLEFVDSAKYHAILPLIPQKEMRRQIELNHRTNSYFFKQAYKVRGFFPPEMCYSDELGRLLDTLGYDWVLASGIACQQTWPLDVIYNAAFGKSTVSVFYRDDILSNKISFHEIDSAGFIAELISLSKDKEDIYVVTAMDAETFGHHIQNWERLFLADVYEIISGVAPYEDLKQRTNLAESHKKILELAEEAQIQAVTVSELLEKFPSKLSQPPWPSSWSTSKDDIGRRNFYPLWKNIGNQIHNLQWEHVRICDELVEAAFELKDNEESDRFYNLARALLDRAIHSCQFWWANKGRMWDVNMINKGLGLQEEVVLNAYKAICTSGTDEETKRRYHHEVIAARDASNKILDQLFA
jgi:alpha-amylase/alpha-mannosidase (GH57 family)